jgi:hypothetical protein
LRYAHADIVKTIRSTDGGAKVDFFLDATTASTNIEDISNAALTMVLTRATATGQQPRYSGLYQTLDELEQAARQALNWLCGAVT